MVSDNAAISLNSNIRCIEITIYPDEPMTVEIVE